MLLQVDKDDLKEAGFTPMEVGMLDRATYTDGTPQKIDLDMGAWQDTLKSRKEYVDNLTGQGWSPGEIKDAIDSYYSESEKATPFDFLREMYRPGARVGKVKDFAFAVEERQRKRADKAERDIREHFGTAYPVRR